MNTPEFLRDYKPNGKEECVVCHKRLKGKISWIGFNTETGNYTYDEKLATQGFFPIGKDCEKKLIKRGEIMAEKTNGYKPCPNCGNENPEMQDWRTNYRNEVVWTCFECDHEWIESPSPETEKEQCSATCGFSFMKAHENHTCKTCFHGNGKYCGDVNCGSGHICNWETGKG